MVLTKEINKVEYQHADSCPKSQAYLFVIPQSNPIIENNFANYCELDPVW